MWDEHWVSVYSVNFNGSFYEMWYDGFDKINTQTGYATSVDGINWVKSPDNPVIPVGELGYWDTWIARIPTVLEQDSVYKMWYYGHDYSRGNIGYATTSVYETITWDTATINKPHTKIRVGILNRIEYINVDSLAEILPGLQGVELADACNKLALAYSLNDHKKSLEYAEKALEISGKHDYPGGRAMALYSIGNSQYIMDDYSAALASQLAALWLFDSLGMLFEQGNLLAQIAGIHSYAGSNELACKYYQQSLDVFEQLNDTGFIVNSLIISSPWMSSNN
jgi:tetratricopeptide (TPR) repeat protein